MPIFKTINRSFSFDENWFFTLLIAISDWLQLKRRRIMVIVIC